MGATAMRERTFRTGEGIHLNIADSESTGRPVVFLHGVTRRWNDWLSVFPQLAPHWRTVGIDLRGHGRSGRSPGAYRVADYVPDIVDFLRNDLKEPAILVGHSLGGNVAAGVAAAASELIHALVLEDPPLRMAGPRLAETPFLATFHVFIQHAGSERSINEIAAEMAEARLPVPGRSDLIRLGDVRDPISLRASAAGLKQLDREVLQVPIDGRWLDGTDLDLILSRIECPTLLIQADINVGGILPDRDANDAALQIRNCVHIKLNGLGHNIHTSATDAMMRLVLPFLGSLE